MLRAALSHIDDSAFLLLPDLCRYLKNAIVYHWSGGHKPWVRKQQATTDDVANDNDKRSAVEQIASLTPKAFHHDLSKWMKDQPYCSLFETPFRNFIDQLRESRDSH